MRSQLTEIKSVFSIKLSKNDPICIITDFLSSLPDT